GTALIILVGETGTSMVGRLLSFKPLVWIGLISYSLYLWHWPVIVFDHIGLFRPLDNAERAIIFTISLVLSVASYFLVERPFRALPRSMPNWRILIPAAGAIGIGVAMGAALIVLAGIPARFSPQANMMGAALDARGPDRFRSGTCFIS